MQHGFFAYIARLKNIRRWSLMRCAVSENVAEHSLQVAMIAHALAVIANKNFGASYDAGKVASIALYHDASEVITGDMPTPIKYYNPEIKGAYKDIEAIADAKLLGMLPQELQSEYAELFAPDDADSLRIVKCADKIAAYLKCLEERQSANAEFRSAEANTLSQIKQMYIYPEVQYFMEHFADSFALTLDELK